MVKRGSRDGGLCGRGERHLTCFHRLNLLTLDIVPVLTPYARANAPFVWDDARIFLTMVSVSFAQYLASPLSCWIRFFWSRSALLSVCVPRNRWAGFTHGGLSQW